MKTLSIDIESRASVNLTKSGVYKYAECPDFDILLFGYSIDHRPVRVIDLASGETLPAEVLDALTDPGVVKTAFNATFERVCLSAWLRRHHPDRLSGAFLDPSRWRCTMVWSAYLGLPMSLDAVAKVLSLPVQKDALGKKLIKQFCLPASPTVFNEGGHFNPPTSDPVAWWQFKDYNARDVEVELAIQDRLAAFPMPEAEWDAYALAQKINDRGVGLDREFVTQAVRCASEHQGRCVARAQALTGLENPNSPLQLKDWLSGKGCDIGGLTKQDVSTALSSAVGDVREVLSLRADMSRASTKKYQAMQMVAGADSRARGLIQFYGAGRTGRFAGRLIQVQNLPRNYLPDLEDARRLVRDGHHEALQLLYPSVPDTLSQLVRTAFVPAPGYRFIVADFSAIEARVIAWLAGETWRLELFRKGGDIYCQSASQMFGVPVGKHGPNADLRQKGKISELACIAEGQQVLTDRGLVAIEEITTSHRVWDGSSWTRHEGVIYKGVRNVITYQGLTATPDHLVWVQGKPHPIPLGEAAANSAHLLQTGNGRNTIRVGTDHQPTETVEPELEPLLRADALHQLPERTVAVPERADLGQVQRMPTVQREGLSTLAQVAGPEAHRGKATVQESERPGIRTLRGAWDRVQVRLRHGSWAVDSRQRCAGAPGLGTGSYRHKRPLRTRQPSLRSQNGQPGQPPDYLAIHVRPKVLALRAEHNEPDALPGPKPRRDHSQRPSSSEGQTEELAADPSKARVYDLRNAGPHNRFTVSNRLVHNCGYNGSVGALKAMGALDMGLAEAELKPLVDAWREANPSIVNLWADVEEAAIRAITTRTKIDLHCLSFAVRSGILFITLPSGRSLAYVQPSLGENRWGGTSINYWGVGANKKWQKLETYGGKLVENIVQAIARDLLTHSLKVLDEAGHRIVMHVHDEAVIEEPCNSSATVESICQLMATPPAWAEGLPLDADGYECAFYKKD